MKKQLLCGVAASALTAAVSGTALAADMPVKAAPLPGCIWSGLYVGAHVGLGQPTYKGTWFGGSFTQDFKQQPSGFLGGAQVGQNWCSNTFVYGWEADVSFMNWKKTSQFSEAGPPADTLTSKLSLLASLRAKLGIPTLDPRTLFFVTAGPAYARGKATLFDSDFADTATASFNKFGGVFGVGLDWAQTDRLSWRLEGLYYIFDTQKTLGPIGLGGDFATDKLKDVLVVRLGLNYKLGDPSGMGSPALGANMPVKAPHYATTFDWSGFYIGGDAGWQGSRIGLSDPDGDPLTFNSRHDSPALGAHIGAQRQFGQLVLGAEGAFVTGFGQSAFQTPSVPIFTLTSVATSHTSQKDIWSAGGRAGWSMGTWMPYITGGYANGSSEFSAVDGSGVPPSTQNAKARESGAYIGGGVDWAVTNNWIFGVEYRRYNFSKKIGAGGGSTPEPVRFDPSTDTVMARLSYKFDWGKAPVVAKY